MPTITVIDIPRSDRTFAYSNHGHRHGRSYVTSYVDTWRIKTLQEAAQPEELPLKELRDVADSLRNLIEYTAYQVGLHTEAGKQLDKIASRPVPAEEAKLPMYVAQLRAIFVSFTEAQREEEARVEMIRAEQDRQHETERQRIREEHRREVEARQQREARRLEILRKDADALRAAIAREEYVAEWQLKQLRKAGLLTEADIAQAAANRKKAEEEQEERQRKAKKAYREEQRKREQEEALEVFAELEERRFLESELVRQDLVSLVHEYGHGLNGYPECNCPKWHKRLRRTALVT